MTAPLNDNFADAIVLSGSLPIVVSGTTTGATVQLDDNELNYYYVGETVWYQWTPPQNGVYSITATSNDFSPYCRVWIAPSVDLGTQVPVKTENTTVFLADSNTTYHIQIGTPFQTSGGNFQLTVVYFPIPENDNFTNATTLSGTLPIVRMGDTNIAASLEENEPLKVNYSEVNLVDEGDYIGTSIWYAWTCLNNGTYKFRADSDSADIVLSVYTGSDLTSLTRIAQSEMVWYPPHYEVVYFEGTANETYYFQVGAYYYTDGIGNSTDIDVELNSFIRPVNDNFESAITLVGTSGWVNSSNIGASVEAGEPTDLNQDGYNEIYKTVWYKWIPLEDSVLTLTIWPSLTWLNYGASAVFNVFTGNSLEDLNFVTLDSSGTRFLAMANTTYYIQVGALPGSYLGEGDFELDFTAVSAPAGSLLEILLSDITLTPDPIITLPATTQYTATTILASSYLDVVPVNPSALIEYSIGLDEFITLNGSTLLEFGYGDNIFQIRGTTGEGSTTYTLTINRLDMRARLSSIGAINTETNQGLTFSPNPTTALFEGVTEFYCNVPSNCAGMQLSLIPLEPSDTIELRAGTTNEVWQAPGTFYPGVNSSIVQARVTSLDSIQRIYTLTLRRFSLPEGIDFTLGPPVLDGYPFSYQGSAAYRFGQKVTCSGDGSIIAVSAAGDVDNPDESKAVYIFSGYGYSNVTKIVAPEGSRDTFGWGLKLSRDGSTLVVGEFAYFGVGHTAGWLGRVLVYKAPNWNLVATLTPTGLASDAVSYFGHSVDISDDGSIIVVGSSRNTSVRVFTGNDYSTQTVLNTSGGTDNTFTTSSVAISGDGTVIAAGTPGAPYSNTATPTSYAGNQYQGKVDVFTGSNWGSRTTIVPSNPQTGRAFGTFVALSESGDKLFATAPGSSNPLKAYPYQIPSGLAYVFSGANYSNEVQLPRNDAAINDGYGSAIAVAQNGSIVIGRNGYNSNPRIERVYIYQSPEDTQPQIWSEGFYAEYIGSSVATSSDASVIVINGSTYCVYVIASGAEWGISLK